jgi:AcrR family transcriptional regulator
VSVPTAARSGRRTEIVQVAYRLIAERGLEGLRFADVAREAGINNGTLLYYFASKDVLIQAVGNYLVEQFSQIGPPPTAAPRLQALAQLRWEFVDARQRLHNDTGAVYTELLARSRRDPAVAALLRSIDAGWRGWLVSILERGCADGVFRADLDLDLAATAIMTAIRGVGTQALITHDPSDVEPLMDTFSELIEAWLVGVAPTPGPLSPAG